MADQGDMDKPVVLCPSQVLHSLEGEERAGWPHTRAGGTVHPRDLALVEPDRGRAALCNSHWYKGIQSSHTFISSDVHDSDLHTFSPSPLMIMTE